MQNFDIYVVQCKVSTVLCIRSVMCVFVWVCASVSCINYYLSVYSPFYCGLYSMM